jgi:hypothetical protein
MFTVGLYDPKYFINGKLADDRPENLYRIVEYPDEELSQSLPA